MFAERLSHGGPAEGTVLRTQTPSSVRSSRPLVWRTRDWQGLEVCRPPPRGFGEHAFNSTKRLANMPAMTPTHRGPPDSSGFWMQGAQQQNVLGPRAGAYGLEAREWKILKLEELVDSS